MLKCLSVQNPWTQEIVTGRKKIEYRTWQVGYRGPVVIHASFKREVVKEEGANPSKFTFGAILGVARLAHVKGSDGEYEWMMRNPVGLATPIPLRGRVSLFALPDEIEQQVREAVEAIKPGWFEANPIQ